jgi:hypothetical protein
MKLIADSLTFFPKFSLTTGGLLASSALTVLIWEHLGRKRDSKCRPSVGLEIISTKSRNLFRTFGRDLAWVSSYLTQIDLQDIGKTLEAVLRPSWNLVTSPLCTISGYVRAAASYKNKQWMVYAGSVIGLALIFYFANQKFGYVPSSLIGRFYHLTN